METVMELSDALPIVAPAIADFARHHAGANDQARKYYFYCLKWMMRGLDQFAKPRVSQKAHERAQEMGLGDLHQYGWDDQHLFMKDAGRKVFHWEHATQTSDLALRVLALGEVTGERVAEALSIFTVVWILKDENRLLPRGLRIDWIETYRVAGIELMPDRRNDVALRRNTRAAARAHLGRNLISEGGGPTDESPMRIIEHVNSGQWVFTQGSYSVSASSSPELCRLAKLEMNVVDGIRSGWDARWRAARRDRQRL
jgi:hypothetical protein